MDLPPLSFNASPEEKWDEEEDPEEIENVLKVVPPAYHQDLDVFSKVKAEKLPPHCACDHHVKLEGLLHPKKDGGFRLCVDYCKLNAVTRKNRYPVPPMNQLVTVFKGSTFFSKIDLRDQSSLQYFMSCKVLTCRQAHWAEFLSEFHFSIPYRPGRLATLPDALSHRDDLYPERGVDFKVLLQDKDFKELLNQLARGESVSDYTLEPQAKLLLFNDRVVIPSNHELQLDMYQKRRDSPLAGHPGQEKTLKLIKRDLYWAVMNQLIKDYVSSCQKCSRNKNIHHKKFGLLKPLKVPSGPWNSLSMDFITQFPLLRSFDSILVILDRFSNMEIFIPSYSTSTALDLAQICISHVFSKNGLPIIIKLKISIELSTAFNPETDVQTERVNQILEQYLWIYVSYHQDDWHTWLPLAEFSYNNSEHSSTKQSPIFTIYERNPSFDSINIPQDTPLGKLSTKLQSVQQVVKKELDSEINLFKKYADRNRETPSDLQPGDRVWLASKSVKKTRPTKKISERWLGLFEVLEKIGSHEYHLKLPQQWKSVHPVFHVSFLEPVKQSTIAN
ncbi:hypothetical protein O181_047143 [Austropuccinia psidii MF-1]|uniref:Integrase zinc-binding domain-containing protein n=1 Tax=Austropuccinia psidii MF-1 TaxID=1389203 RepID=A0A9Q3HJ80_9BASI|nr:hypothetical protein [Austropuccinia psidii MF-1]